MSEIKSLHLYFPEGITHRQAQDVAHNAENIIEFGISEGGNVIKSGSLFDEPRPIVWDEEALQFVYAYKRERKVKLGTKKEDIIWKTFHKCMPLRVKREDLALIGKDFYMFKEGFLKGEEQKEKEIWEQRQAKRAERSEPPLISPQAEGWLKSLVPWMFK